MKIERLKPPAWLVVAALATCLAAINLTTLSPEITDTAQLARFGIYQKLAVATCGMVCVLISLRLKNLVTGTDWKSTQGRINETPMSASVYNVGWVLGFCVLYGLVLG